MSNNKSDFLEGNSAYMESYAKVLKKKDVKRKKKPIKAVAIISLVAISAFGRYKFGDKIVDLIPTNEKAEDQTVLPTDLEENAALVYNTFEEQKTGNLSEDMSTLCLIIKEDGLDSYEGLDNIQVLNKYFDMLNIKKGSVDKRLEAFETLGATLVSERVVIR